MKGDDKEKNLLGRDRESSVRDFSVAAREAALADRSSEENPSDQLADVDRPAARKASRAFDDGRDDKGDDGNSEARLEIPVSRR